MNKFYVLILALAMIIVNIDLESSTQEKLQGYPIRTIVPKRKLKSNKSEKKSSKSKTHKNLSSHNVIEFEQDNSEQFIKLINKHENVVVDFFMEGCPPCKKFLHDLPEIAREFSMVTFIKSKNNSLKRSYGVQANPTFIYFKNGQEVYRKAGYSSKNTVTGPIEKYLLTGAR